MKIRIHSLRLILTVLITLGFLCFSDAQDIHFTQFDASPLFLNPANTGHFVGDWRVATNYRNQWRTISDPFSTVAASFDKHFYVFGEKIGAGILFVNDQTGTAGIQTNQIYASAAYAHVIQDHYIRGGLQIGYVHGSIGDNQTTPGMYNRETNKYDLPPLQNLLEKQSYLDINLGVLWKKSINIFEPEVGIALAHLNNPNYSFIEGDERLPMRFTLHTNIKTKFSDEFYILPTIFYTNHKSASETMVGLQAGYNLFGSRSLVKNIIGGFYLRNGIFTDVDAIAILVGTTVGRMDIGLSYDLNISNLSKISGNTGALEFSIIYKSISTVLNSYSIPCERF